MHERSLTYLSLETAGDIDGAHWFVRRVCVSHLSISKLKIKRKA